MRLVLEKVQAFFIEWYLTFRGYFSIRKSMGLK